MICGTSATGALLDLRGVPVHCNVPARDRSTAIAVPRADICLQYCGNCAHVFNRAFDPALVDYAQDYENALDHSPTFRDYADALADRLIDRCGLHDKSIVEIGCGRGTFLRLLCERGGNSGLGLDPSYRGEPQVMGGRVRFQATHFDSCFDARDADLICCRHALEHMHRPSRFLAEVREALRGNPQAFVFMEVPNSLYTLERLGIWDLIYEHCSYFCPSSLTRAFERAGFTVVEVEATFGGQFLTILARPRTAGDPVSPWGTASVTGDLMTRFGARFEDKAADWRNRLKRLSGEGKRVVVWGCGSKGVTFLNVVAGQAAIDYVVDINPKKWGRFVPGTGQEVVDPGMLRDYRPDAVIVMNAIYRDEVLRTLESLGVSAEVLSA